jgi:hypothetical protein
VAVLPSVLVFAHGVHGMVGSNRADYRISVPLAIVSALTVLLLIQEYTVTRSSGARVP